VISNNRDALEQLQKQMGTSGGGDAALEVVMKHYASLTAEVAAKELENFELRRNLLVKGEEVYVQPSSLPGRKVSPKRSMVVLLAILLSGFVLLLFVFLRKALHGASQDADASVKIAVIKKSLGFSV
jgi:LPS O-antigen subunit length determinant protein (WzzB/FepE family)